MKIDFGHGFAPDATGEHPLLTQMTPYGPTWWG